MRQIVSDILKNTPACVRRRARAIVMRAVFSRSAHQQQLLVLSQLLRQLLQAQPAAEPYCGGR